MDQETPELFHSKNSLAQVTIKVTTDPMDTSRIITRNREVKMSTAVIRVIMTVYPSSPCLTSGKSCWIVNPNLKLIRRAFEGPLLKN
jgi:hypothetical protein